MTSVAFEKKVHSDGYDNPLPYSRHDKAVREAYDAKNSELHEAFMSDLTAYLTENGVPAQYARKLAYKAYEDGHSSGYTEVFCVASNWMEIFQK